MPDLWTAADDEKLLTLREQGLSWYNIQKHFPTRNTEAIRCHYYRVKRDVKPADDVTDSITAERVLTLEDLLAETQVDLEKWDVERFVVNKYEVGMKISEEGQPDKVATTPMWQIKAWFKPKPRKERMMEELRKGLIEDIRNEPQYISFATSNFPKKRASYLFEFSPFDLHLGKLCWGEETVTNYDVESAEKLFNASLDFLLTKALRLSDGTLDRVLCVFGNDAMHVDSKRMQTTAGTPMDFDSRYIKMYRRLIAIHRRAVEILRQVAPVDILIVPGNHDELTAFHMGEVLAARYEDVKHVTVDNSPSLRKYYEYGVNAFGFTHGDAEKVSELPLLMARERPEMWARCPSREWHIGHKHISEKWESNRRPMLEQDLVSDKGIRIRRLTSMSAHDAWHTKHAYTDRRACEAFLFHKEAGFTDHISFNVDHFTGKALSI
jgi:hypothetical protein